MRINAMSLKMPETRHFGCEGHIGSSNFRAGKSDLPSRKNSYIRLGKRTLAEILAYCQQNVLEGFEFLTKSVKKRMDETRPK